MRRKEMAGGTGPWCWAETWAKRVDPSSKLTHHSAVAYVRRNEKDEMNVQFYCNHGTCPGFEPLPDDKEHAHDKMYLISVRKYEDAASCPDYLLSCDMLRSKHWTKDEPEHFKYLVEGHVCNTDSNLEEYAFDNKIKNVEALNANPQLLEGAYKICSVTHCQTPGKTADGKKPSLKDHVIAQPIFPDIYNIWKTHPEHKSGLDKTNVYTAYYSWKAKADAESLNYADLVQYDIDPDPIGKAAKLIKKQVPRRIPRSLFKVEQWRNLAFADKSHYVAGFSKADFVIAADDYTAEPHPSSPGWLDKNWIPRRKFKV